jgi:hypothetical protein
MRITYDREITNTLFARLREARVMRCVEHYARDHVGNLGGRIILPVREETIATCIQALYRGYTERSEEVSSLRAEVESLRAEITRSDERRTKAKECRDLPASAYSLVEKEIPKRKRARD